MPVCGASSDEVIKVTAQQLSSRLNGVDVLVLLKIMQDLLIQEQRGELGLTVQERKEISTVSYRDHLVPGNKGSISKSGGRNQVGDHASRCRLTLEMRSQ